MDTADPSGWIRLASAADVQEGVPVRVGTHDNPVCLVRSGDKLHAILDRCSPQDVPLSEGDVTDNVIECFMHGSQFNLETGEAMGPPALGPVPVYPVDERDGEIYVALPHTSSQ